MHKPFKIPWQYLAAISSTGLGMGFLVGLSASPVVSALIGGIVSLAAGVVSALCGVRLDKGEGEESPAEESPNLAVASQKHGSAFTAHVNPLPIAFLVISIVLGSLVGLLARTQEWFAESTEHLVDKWQKSTGLSSEAIAVRLFASIYGDGNAAESPHAGVLFAVAEDHCRRLRQLDTKDLRLELEALGNPNVKEFASKCNDEDLKLALDLLLCPEKDKDHK